MAESSNLEGREGRLEALLGRLLARGCAAVVRRATAVCIAVAVLSVAAGVYTARNLGVNADLETLFSAELPYMVLEREFAKRFPVLDRNILVVVDGDSSEQAGQAAREIARRALGAESLFHGVFLPRDAFFEEHAFLYMDTDELEGLSDRLARVQPYLAALAKDGSLRGLCDLLARALLAAEQGEISGAELEPIFKRFDQALRALEEGRHYRVSWAEVVAGHDLDVDQRRRFVLVEPVLELDQWVAGEKVMKTLHAWADELEAAGGVRVRLSGNTALNYEEMGLASRQSKLAGLASFVVVSVLLVFAMRSYRLVLSTVVMILASLLWTAAAAALTVGSLNVISMAFAVIVLGLNADAGIHVCMRYQELAAEGRSHLDAMCETMRSVGTSILLCGVTTAVGFYAFAPTDFAGVAELGIIAGNGIVIGLLSCFILLPALITALRGRGHSLGDRAGAAALSALPKLSTRYPRTVAISALLSGLAAATLLPHFYFDQNPLHVRDPNAESVQVLEEIMADGGASPWDLSAYTPDLDSAGRLAERLRELPEVASATSVLDYIPKRQEEKLSIIEDVAMFMAPPPSKDAIPAKPSREQQLQSLQRFEHVLARIIDPGQELRVSGTEQSFLATARALHQDLLRFLNDGGGRVEELEQSLLSLLPEQLDLLEKAVSIGPVTFDSLPEALVERMVSKSGEARVRISPSGDMNDNQALSRFVDAVRKIAPDVTGSAVRINIHAHEAVTAFKQALGGAIVAIVVIVFLIWRTIGDTLLVLAPLTLASLLTVAGAVLLDIPLNFADIIVLPLLLGIGVDSGIHLVHRARQGVDSRDLLATSTARAVLFSSLTTIASFGTLGFASHRGMASIGRLLTLGVGLALLCNLLILPALIELRARYRERSANS